MAELYYPHDYLPMPLRTGLGFKPVSPILRTEMTSGRARQRRRYKSTPTQAEITWVMTDSQSQLFEAWFSEIIIDGSSWFYMQIRTPMGVQSYKCRFTDIYEGPTLFAIGRWQFSATLELWERPILPPGWAEFPDFIVNQSIIDIALNREWPEA
ncbi:hypothetical protein JHU04_002515 [Brenneria sp. 4F2]|nr:hypothetical protein [Brenneria bubanii]